MRETLQSELTTLTTDLMRFQSTADQPDQIRGVMQYVTDYVSELPGLLLHPSESNGIPALVVTLHDTRTPALMLNGHLDVVAGTPDQFEPQVRDGRIYGRGSQDMKGSIAVLLRLLKHLATLDPRPDVGVQFVCDEEIGGKHGSQRLVAEGWGGDFCITAEPTSLHICYEQKGAVWMELRLPGSPAHGSRPWEGRNPLYAYANGLAGLMQRFPPPDQEGWQTTITPTIVDSGGNSRNQVPASLRCTFDIRHIASDQPDELAVTLLSFFPGAEVVTSRTGVGLYTNPDTPAITRLAAVIEQITGRSTQLYREHFGSDARFFSASNIPAVCCGPVGAGLHSAEEWVDIASLEVFYQVLQSYITTMRYER